MQRESQRTARLDSGEHGLLRCGAMNHDASRAARHGMLRSPALVYGLVLTCALGGCFRIGYEPAPRQPGTSAGKGGGPGQGGAGAHEAVMQDGGGTDAGEAGTGADSGANSEAGAGGGSGADGGADSGTAMPDAAADSGPTQTPEDQCLALAFGGLPECKNCRCAQCTDAVLRCSGIGAGSDANCQALVSCGRANSCTGEICSCGSSPQCESPNGLCASELIDAARAAGLTPAECNTEPTCAGFQALAVSDCVVSRCSDECL